MLALLLASIGLYGTMAYAVSRRTREIGIRMALGAERGKLARMVLRDSLMLVAMGAIAGVPLALAATRLVESLLYGLSPNDPAVLAGAALVLLTAAIIASYLPARRATRVDPMLALRNE